MEFFSCFGHDSRFIGCCSFFPFLFSLRFPQRRCDNSQWDVTASLYIFRKESERERKRSDEEKENERVRGKNTEESDLFTYTDG